ncbi:hypothetical protein BC831DRAFT_170760 [Entophlyctis helioformis]|nr:hypothetical protein BC831DRAFT_170760 [Entophlyctis helioformis]
MSTKCHSTAAVKLKIFNQDVHIVTLLHSFRKRNFARLMPAPIPFDPPRFDQPEDFVAICIGVGCFPLVCYAWYHAALAFFRTHKQLPGTLLLLLTVALFRNIATVTVTFLYTSLPLLLFRLWLFCIEMYILNVWIMVRCSIGWLVSGCCDRTFRCRRSRPTGLHAHSCVWNLASAVPLDRDAFCLLERARHRVG